MYGISKKEVKHSLPTSSHQSKPLMSSSKALRALKRLRGRSGSSASTCLSDGEEAACGHLGFIGLIIGFSQVLIGFL